MISRKKLHENESIRYRMLIFNSALVYPVWGYLLKSFEPQLFDPLWIRFAISTSLLGALTFTFFSKSVQSHLEKILIASGWMMLTHSAWLLWANQFPFSVFCSFLIFLCCLLNVFPSRASTWCLGSAAGLFGVAIALVPNSWHISPVIVNVALWSSIAPSLVANFTRIRHLNSLWGLYEEASALFENIQEGLLILGPDHRISSLNSAAHEIFGLKRSQMLGQKFEWEFLQENGSPLHPEDNPVKMAQSQNQIVRDFLMGVRRPDGGTAWLKITASPFKASPDESQQFTLVTFSDIGELRKTQKTILEQQARLEANSKLAALGEMAAGIAHEINNPLAIISGRVFVIQKGLSTQKFIEPIEKSLEKIKTTVERIQRIIKGLQTFSLGGDRDPFQKVFFQSLVDEALSYCQHKIDKHNIQIQLEIEQDLVLECRPVQLSQSLVNLISNACDAIEHQSQPWIRIWARSAHNMAVLKITDSGNGIPAEVQKKLMQPFFTTKEVGKGTGLGLSITRGLVHSHLGKLWLDTNSSHTTFVIELPLEQNLTQKAA